MVRRILIVSGLGVVLSSSILAPAEKAPSKNPKPNSETELRQTDPVNFSLESGAYSTPQRLVLSDSQPGAVIYYTTNPNMPVTTWNISKPSAPVLVANPRTPLSSWTVYNPAAPIVVNTTETITAVAQAPGFRVSDERENNYHVTAAQQAAPPNFSLAAGVYTDAQALTLSSTTPNASFCYTTNGKSPSAGGDDGEMEGCTRYTGPITVDRTETVEAVTMAPGYKPSDVKNSQYVLAASGNSMLGMLEGTISFCSKKTPGTPSGYFQVDQFLIKDPQMVQERNSNDYKTTFSGTVDLLRALPASEAATVCSSN